MSCINLAGREHGSGGQRASFGGVHRAGALGGWLVTSQLVNYVGTAQPLTLPVTI